MMRLLIIGSCALAHLWPGRPRLSPPRRCSPLLLVGAVDPVHPRESSDAIARHLIGAQVIELPGLGHGTVDAHACPRALMRAFLADPAAPLDTSCVAGMPGPFRVGSAAAGD